MMWGNTQKTQSSRQRPEINPLDHERFKHRVAAFAALSLGPLDHTPDGWISRRGEPGIWNSHTLNYLAGLGLASINHGRTVASITARGRAMLPGEDYAA